MSHCTLGPYTREVNDIVAPSGETLATAYQMDSAEDRKHYCRETLANAALFTASWQMYIALQCAKAHIEYSERTLGSVAGGKETKSKIADAIEAAEDY